MNVEWVPSFTERVIIKSAPFSSHKCTSLSNSSELSLRNEINGRYLTGVTLKNIATS